MIPCSAGSASKTTEQVGSIMSSRKTMWTGRSTSGHWKSTGIRDMPTMGKWMASIYAVAFLRLSKILRPILTAETMDEKSSSRRTSSEASLATSVPLPPILTPIWADLRAGASLTPSPVIATISPRALSAFTMRSFCSGTTLAKMFTEPIFL